MGKTLVDLVLESWCTHQVGVFLHSVVLCKCLLRMTAVVLYKASREAFDRQSCDEKTCRGIDPTTNLLVFARFRL